MLCFLGIHTAPTNPMGHFRDITHGPDRPPSTEPVIDPRHIGSHVGDLPLGLAAPSIQTMTHFSYPPLMVFGTPKIPQGCQRCVMCVRAGGRARRDNSCLRTTPRDRYCRPVRRRTTPCNRAADHSYIYQLMSRRGQSLTIQYMHM